MSDPDPYNVNSEDPTNLTYISKKNWARKQNIVNGNNKMSAIFGKPGPLTGIVLSLFNSLTYIALRFIFNILKICTYSFEWVNNITFGNFKGIIPTSLKNGKVITMKFFRYTMTMLMPPVGIMLSKGLYGWFNMILCMIITYVNFLAGIIYAFVITSRNRYADQYETEQLKIAMDRTTPEEQKADSSALKTFGIFILVIISSVYLFICYV
jgi:uncharacterized membrane protein YqaE (UPF0057 family)